MFCCLPDITENICERASRAVQVMFFTPLFLLACNLWPPCSISQNYLKDSSLVHEMVLSLPPSRWGEGACGSSFCFTLHTPPLLCLVVSSFLRLPTFLSPCLYPHVSPLFILMPISFFISLLQGISMRLPLRLSIPLCLSISLSLPFSVPPSLCLYGLPSFSRSLSVPPLLCPCISSSLPPICPSWSPPIASLHTDTHLTSCADWPSVCGKCIMENRDPRTFHSFT